MSESSVIQTTPMLWSAARAAREIGITRWTLDRWVRLGHLSFIRVPSGRKMFNPEILVGELANITISTRTTTMEEK